MSNDELLIEELCAMRKRYPFKVFFKSPPEVWIKLSVLSKTAVPQLIDESTVLVIRCKPKSPELLIRPKDGLSTAVQLLSVLNKLANEAPEGETIRNLVEATKKFLSEENVQDSPSTESLASDSGEPFTASYRRYHTEFVELEKLGEGGFGLVYKCCNKLDTMVYAMKKVPFKDGDDEPKIFREVQAFSCLQHPNVVRYYQAWIEDGVPVEDTSSGTEDDPFAMATKTLFIQMEFCTGTLQGELEREIDSETAWRHFWQMVEALLHIHEKGIIHRDLSRANIFLDSLGNIKIGDFGLAKFIDGQAGSIISTGSIGNKIYRAPEVIGNSPAIDSKVDIFSLGLLLFEMLYHLDTEMERILAFKNLRDGKFPADCELQQSTFNLLKELLHSLPSERPSAADILKRQLPDSADTSQLKNSGKSSTEQVLRQGQFDE